MNSSKSKGLAKVAGQAIPVLMAGLFLSAAPSWAQQLSVHESAQKGDFSLVSNGKSAAILHDAKDAKVVGIAADLLGQDIGRVTGVNASTTTDRSQAVIIGTA